MYTQYKDIRKKKSTHDYYKIWGIITKIPWLWRL